MLYQFFPCNIYLIRDKREYASEVAAELTSRGIFADADNGEDTLKKKIRNGEIAQYNFILGMLIKTMLYSDSSL